MKKVKIKLKPYTLVVRTTERCNVGCDHCSISATRKGNDIPLEVAKKAISDAKQLGIKRIHFTGGEPLLYPYLEELFEWAKTHEMSFDFTSSTYTEKVDNTLLRFENLKKKGLDCVMLSFDEPHSKRVTIKQFSSFVKSSLDSNLHVCVFVTEGGGYKYSTVDLKNDLLKEKIDVDKIEWSISQYQYEGRGRKEDIHHNNGQQNIKKGFCRCPYIMAVPTLNPDGKVLLCHMSRFKTANFTVGDYNLESMNDILNKMETKPIYRFLAKYGPQQSLLNLGILENEIPNDMCHACEYYLKLTNIKLYFDRLIEITLSDDLSNIEVDLEGVLPIYQRFLVENGERL